MPGDFLPHRDSLLLAWSAAFSAGITASPISVGLTAAQATAYATLHTAFSTALGAVTDPSTRTRGNVSAKNVARTSLKAQARDLARVVNAFPSITNEQRINLGLTPRKSTIGPINPPTESPVMEVVSANGRTLKLKLHAVGSDRRGKPVGVAGASVFSSLGATPPADIAAWKFEGSTTRTTFDLAFEASVPAGSQVWLTAFWFNPRSMSGPACTPISAYVAGGVSMAA